MINAAQTSLVTWVVAWGIAAVALMFFFSRQGQATVGLKTLFILSYMLQYWFGTLIHVLPWYVTNDRYLTYLGMRECSWALLGFAIGALLIAPLFLSFFRFTWAQGKKFTPHPSLPMICVITGTLMYVFSPRLLENIPTIRNLSYLSWNFTVASVCLLSWQAYAQKNNKLFIGCLIFALFLPFFTTATMGFIGYGTQGTLVILAFASVFYRPRAVTFVGMLIAVFLGMSLFVTYLRDRDEIRGVVWTGQDMTVRIDKMMNMIVNFEFIDLQNQKHLQRIDSRINQNYLVGAAVNYLQNGREKFAEGETIVQSFFGFIPRILWPDKPITAGGSSQITQYTGIIFSTGTSIGMGPVMEFYINFGTPLVLIGFMLFGALIAFFDAAAKALLDQGDWAKFLLNFMLGLSFISPLGYFGEVVMICGASVFFYVVIIKLALPAFTKLKSQAKPQ